MKTMLEIRHLQSALRSAGSLVRAAQLLNLTQSALSHQIKLLEDRYGGRFLSANRYRSASLPRAPAAQAGRPAAARDRTAEREVARLMQGDSGQLRVLWNAIPVSTG
jgi:LysR family transcriptional regulator for metE and metH